MEGVKIVDPVDTVSGILAQLKEYTAQLASIEECPGVNVVALATACGKRLEELREVLPQALENQDRRPELLGAMREVHAGAVSCSGILEKAREETAREIGFVSKFRRAIGAYGRR